MRRLLLFAVALIMACNADDIVRQGEVGELCNGAEDDCRPGLVCAQRICAEPGPPPTYDCGDICARLQSCDVALPACEADCRITTSDWIMRAREDFGVCLVEQLTCDEAAASFAPQTCYSRIEIPADRWAVCTALAEAALGCATPRAEAERVLEGCAAIARVGTDEAWAGPLRCDNLIETGVCGELATCFSRELQLEPEPVTF